jgi:hypothetical protein
MSRFSRQIMAFAEEGQGRISAHRVGIVGLGGLGSHLVQSLAYLGVRNFVLVDDGIVEESNLNRLIGATSEDVYRGLPKTAVAERVIRAIEPSSTVTAIQENVCSESAISSLKSCSTIFGSVDHDGPRLLMMELAAAYEVTLIDSASDIILDESRTVVTDFGGRVVLCRPGDFCLVCAKEFDEKAAKIYFEDPESVRVREEHGYGLGPTVPSPSVISLNGVVANLAATEFMCMVTGLREPKRKRVYQGMRGVVLDNTMTKEPDCYNCGYLVGKADRAELSRYTRTWKGRKRE